MGRRRPVMGKIISQEIDKQLLTGTFSIGQKPLNEAKLEPDLLCTINGEETVQEAKSSKGYKGY